MQSGPDRDRFETQRYRSRLLIFRGFGESENPSATTRLATSIDATIASNTIPQINQGVLLWLAHPGEDEACSGGSRQALGKTAEGRFLRVVYMPDDEGDGVFVVTAYPLDGKQLKAFRRRQRRRGK